MSSMLTKNTDLENVINRELSENYQIRESVSNCAGTVGGTMGVLGGVATFLGLAGISAYYGANFLISSSPEKYVPEMMVCGLTSLPVGFISYMLLGTLGHGLGYAYGVAKNALTHGPIITYRALRNKKQIEDAKILSVC